jgi:hypothetical protein
MKKLGNRAPSLVLLSLTMLLSAADHPFTPPVLHRLQRTFK